jgi:hypothetical protein
MALTLLTRQALESALTEPSAYTEIKAILEGTDHTSPLTAGTGITTGSGTVYKSWKEQNGGVIHTSIFIDITGLQAQGTLNYIIGKDAQANCHLGQITTAVTGTIFAGQMSCLEAPVNVDQDIDLSASTSAVLVESTDITAAAGFDLIQGVNIDWTADNTTTGVLKFAPADLPGTGDYLYLSVGEGGTGDGAATYGQFLIEFWGTAS